MVPHFMEQICKTYTDVDTTRPEPLSFTAQRARELHTDRTTPVIVSVGGPGGTGKTTFSRSLADLLGEAVVIHLDDYKTPRRERAARGLYGPHPEANRLDLMREHLLLLRSGQAIEKPVHCREDYSLELDADGSLPASPRLRRTGRGFRYDRPGKT